MRVFFFLFLVVAIWVGLEVTNKGMSGAFDGAFVRVGLASPSVDEMDTVAGRASGSVEDAYRRSEERVTRQTD
jgi:hypothetical protein